MIRAVAGIEGSRNRTGLGQQKRLERRDLETIRAGLHSEVFGDLQLNLSLPRVAQAAQNGQRIYVERVAPIHISRGQRPRQATRKQLERGARVTELLKQAQYSPLPISLMGVTLFAVNMGVMDDIDVKKVLSFEHGLHAYLKDKHAALLATIESNGAKWDVKPAKADDNDSKKALKKVCQDAEAELKAAVIEFKKSFA